PLEIADGRLHRVEVDSAKECGGRLAVSLLSRVEIDQPFKRLRDPPRRNLRRQTSKDGAILVRPAADHHEVLWYGARPAPAEPALETNGRDVMLTATVGAAADLDPRAVGGRNQIRPCAQMVLEQTAEAARLGDRESA